MISFALFCEMKNKSAGDLAKDYEDHEAEYTKHNTFINDHIQKHGIDKSKKSNEFIDSFKKRLGHAEKMKEIEKEVARRRRKN